MESVMIVISEIIAWAAIKLSDGVDKPVSRLEV
jgi:hypothetical protein